MRVRLLTTDKFKKGLALKKGVSRTHPQFIFSFPRMVNKIMIREYIERLLPPLTVDNVNTLNHEMYKKVYVTFRQDKDEVINVLKNIGIIIETGYEQN